MGLGSLLQPIKHFVQAPFYVDGTGKHAFNSTKIRRNINQKDKNTFELKINTQANTTPVICHGAGSQYL